MKKEYARKYIVYKDDYYYLRYLDTNRIIYKSITFTSLLKFIVSSKFDLNLIYLHTNLYDMKQHYIVFPDEEYRI